MKLTLREKDKLMIALAALVARGRLARGVKLNYPESVALRFRHGGSEQLLRLKPQATLVS